jgi:hypothetical protein
VRKNGVQGQLQLLTKAKSEWIVPDTDVRIPKEIKNQNKCCLRKVMNSR